MFLHVLALAALLAGAAPSAQGPADAHVGPDSSAAVSSAAVSSAAGAGVDHTLQPEAVVTGWRAQAEDNIVGLRDPKKLSNPALVDYSALMAATPEMKRIKREGIDESSPEGIQLKNRASSKVATACETVMNAGGHCSVWKTISHEDGRTITDLTTKVKRRL